jgi:DNA repair exonuclease SbcCD ATPase subunit
MINFTKLVARDCFAYVVQEFDFVTGINSIEGVNGASKTSIFLTLCQGLYNRNPKGAKLEEVNNSITMRPYEIEIWFTKGHDKFRILNSRKTGTIGIFRNDRPIHVKKITDNLKLIEDIVGCDYALFVDLTYQSPKSSINLLEVSTDNSRKAFVNRILRMDELDYHLDRLKAQEKALTGKRGVIDTLNQQVSNLSASFSETIEEAQEEKPTVLLERLVSGEGARRDESIRIQAQIKNEIKSAESSMEEYYEDKMARDKREALREGINRFVLPALSLKEVEDKLSFWKSEVVKKQTELKSVEGELKTLNEAMKRGVCPTCSQGVQYGHFSELLHSLEQQRVVLEAAQSEAIDNKAQLSEDLAEWVKYGNLNRELSKLKGESTCNVNIEACTTRHTNLLREYSEQAAELKRIEAELASVTKALKDATEFNALQRARVAVNAQKLETNARISDQLVAAKLQLEEAEARLDLLKLWGGILGAKGYRVHKMDSFLRRLNLTMRKYADMISNGRIACSFFTTDGEIDFTVTDANKTIPYVCWSEGEKARVKLACLFSVLELLEIAGAVSFNVLALDEVFSALDDDGKEGLFRVLSYLRNRDKCIYTIAHTKLALDKVYDNVIYATKHPDGTASVAQ